MKSFLLFFVLYTTVNVDADSLRGYENIKAQSSFQSASSLDLDFRKSRSESDDEDFAEWMEHVDMILTLSNTIISANSPTDSAASISTASENSWRSASSPSVTTLTGNSRKQSPESVAAPTLAHFLPLL